VLDQHAVVHDHVQAADLARAAGLDVVMNHCMLIEHRKLGERAA